MLKKWKKTVKLFATTILVLVYVTIGLFNNEALKGDERKKKTFVLETNPTTKRYLGTIKTIVGYSREFNIRKQLQERIECDPEYYPDNDDQDGITSKWRYDRKLRIHIFSAYYDQRHELYHYIRIIGLLPRNSSFYCQMWYQNNDTVTYVTQKAIVQEIWSKEWGPKDKTCEDEYPALISCLCSTQNETVPPSWVTFVDKSCAGAGTFVKITPPSTTKLLKNFVVCVKPLHLTNINRKALEEWIEINNRLGANEIVIYSSDLTDWYLDDRKSVMRKEFETPTSSCPSRNFEHSIWYKRKMEIIAYNDCFYSHLYDAEFVIPLDVDEIIVPKIGNNWFETFHAFFKLSEDRRKSSWSEYTLNYASLSVRNAYFFSHYPRDAIIRSLKLPKHDKNVPKKLVKALLRQMESSNIFDRKIRSRKLSPSTDSVKSFIRVSKTLSIFNHFAFHVLDDARRQFIFPESAFQLNHYRNSCDPVLIDGCKEFLNEVVFDDSLEKFRNKTEVL